MSDPNSPVVKMIQEMRTRVRKDLYSGKLNYEASTALLQRQIPIADRMNDLLLKGQIYESLGTVELELGNYEKGYNYYQESLKAFTNIEDSFRIGVMLSNLGEIYRRWGKPEEAADYYVRARELARQSGQNRLVITTYNNEGQVWLAVGQVERAIELLEMGLKISDETDWEITTRQQSVPEILSSLAEAYGRLGDYNLAWTHSTRALNIANQHNQVHQIARAYQAMAFIAIQEKREPESITDYLMMSREYWLKIGSKVELGHLMQMQGDYWMTQENPAKAIPAYMEAVQYYEDTHMHTELEKIRALLALQ
jgi:tetratricopeptide (TPR) repeat protein